MPTQGPPKINTPVTTKYIKIKYLPPATPVVSLLNPNTTSFGDLMDKIQNTIDGYNKYNEYLMKNAITTTSEKIKLFFFII